MNENNLDISNNLLNELTLLIQNSKQHIALSVNNTVTTLYWHIGNAINANILNNNRADYGAYILPNLSEQLVSQFGKSFETRNLRRMVQFATIYPNFEIVAPVVAKLSWSHFLILFPIKTDEARSFYIQKSIDGSWSKRELKNQIERKAFERSEIAQLSNSKLLNKEIIEKSVFKDPYILDFLELKNTYLEKDLESAIMRELESFILELGVGFTFVERQKRMILDGKDFNLDLLFYHRKLKRLVAIELKLNEFKPSYKGQMELYLKWLNRYEKQEGENTPIGIILCAEASKEQVELLEMHKDGIMVSEYWTELPAKALLEAKLHSLLIEAKDRLETLKIDNK